MKKLISLLEMDSNDFRTKIKGLGYTEKQSELTSNGNLNPDFLDILSQLFDEWNTSNPNCKVMFTAGNDNSHKTSNSLHTVGLAIDLTIDGGCKSSFLSLLNTYKTKYLGFSYIDEYEHPSKNATGPHIHISYRKGAPENGDATYTSSEQGSLDSDEAINSYVKNTMLGLSSTLLGGKVNEEIKRIKRMML
jgi:hypothetical protein